MTQTTITTDNAQTDHPIHPADILMNLIITVLAPLFLTASGGDIAYARLAAFETVQSYRTRNHADLIGVAQIIACGLSALGSLGLAMTDEISLSMTIRLRGTATGLMRSAEQVRCAMKETQTRTDTAPPHETRQDPEINEAAVIANVAEVQQRAAEHQARLQAESQPPTPPPAEPKTQASETTQATTEQRHIDALWASAMTQVASEFAASLPDLPPLERKQASRRAALLSSTANDLIAGTTPPRPRPGDLSPLIHPPAS